MKRAADLRLAGLAEDRVLTGPQTVHIDVMNGCNTNCITCWDHSPLLRVGRSTAWKRQRVDLATVTAHFGVVAAPALSEPPEPSDDIPAPSSALRHGWVMLLNVGKGIAAAGAFALPFVVVALPVVLGWRVVQRRTRRLAR